MSAYGILATTLIEVGDGFSDEHGFSWEDEAFNVAGVSLAYLRLRFPEFGKRVQFRWKYFPSAEVRNGDEMDIFTDYEGSRWMLAFPLKGWMRERSWLDWVDLLVGYGTRDFEDRQGQLSGRGNRYPFIGIASTSLSTRNTSISKDSAISSMTSKSQAQRFHYHHNINGMIHSYHHPHQ